MVSLRFKITELRRFPSSATYVLLPQTQLDIDYYAAEPALDLTLLETSSDNKSSAPRLELLSEEAEELARAEARLAVLREEAAQVIRGDEEGPYEWTDEGLADMRERVHAAWRSASRRLARGHEQGD